MATTVTPSDTLTGVLMEVRRQQESKRDLLADTRRVQLAVADPEEEEGRADPP